MKAFKLFLLVASVAAMMSCEENEFIQREEDSLTFDCLAQSLEQNILARGDWFVDLNSNDWITVSPMSGTGNGVDYQMYTVSVAYNKGGAREGIIYICQGDLRCPVSIHQNRCKFGYTGIAVPDTLFRGMPSDVGILVNYEYAAGDETVVLKATLSGTAAQGLEAADVQTSDFRPGSGSLFIPITGTPVNKGVFSVSVMAGTRYVGDCTAIVDEYVAPEPEPAKADGFPVGWNFFAAGLSGTEPINTEKGQYWTIDDSDPRVYPTSGKNPDAVLRAVLAEGHLNPQAAILSPKGAADAYTYNCAMQINGMLENDYWLVEVPVYHVNGDCKISVEAAVSTASKGVGFYIMEYSSNKTTWFEVPGATEFTKDGTAFKAHYWNTLRSTANKGKDTTEGPGHRKSYDKSSDDTYHKYVFSPSEIDIEQGTFYLRLRALKYNYSMSADVVAAWTDLKGIELDFVEE